MASDGYLAAMGDQTTSVGDVPHRTASGRFFNPWHGERRRGLRDFFKWVLIERLRHPRLPDPDPRSLARATPAFRTPHAAPDEIVVTWIGHTSFLVQIGGANVLLDPVWGRRTSPVPFAGPQRQVPPGIDFDALPPIDLVVISHDHYDHLDLPTVRRIVRRHTLARWVAPLGVGTWLRRHAAVVATELDWWQTTRVGVLELGCTPAKHFAGRTPYNRDRTLWSGWSIRASDRAVFFAGDTGRHSEFEGITREFGPFNAAFLPIGAYDPRRLMRPVHMDPAEAVDAYTDVICANGGEPCTFVATHWGTFKLTDEPLDEPPRLTREAWRRAGLDEALLWIPQHGETRTIVVAR
jgi:N-acyl-phosphatidylethanolamine-hydrolysing phospholipase D